MHKQKQTVALNIQSHSEQEGLPGKCENAEFNWDKKLRLCFLDRKASREDCIFDTSRGEQILSH